MNNRDVMDFANSWESLSRIISSLERGDVASALSDLRVHEYRRLQAHIKITELLHAQDDLFSQWDGHGIPKIGMSVAIDTASSGRVPAVVVDVEYTRSHSSYAQVMVHVAYADSTYGNCRMLGEVYPITAL